VTRKAFALAVAALLIAVAGGTGRAHAAGGTFRIVAGGDQDWTPENGTLDQTASDKIEATGTMVTTEQRSGTNGTADYHIASGPGVVRAQVSGSFTTPSNLAYPFNPSLQAVSTTELTINAPDDVFVNTTVNVHVDGIIKAPVCGDKPTCGGENIFVSVGPFQRTAEFDTFGTTRANDLGLALDPVPGGYRVHGDVISSTLGIRTNTPFPVTLVLNVSGRYGSGPAPTTIGGDFDDPAAMYQFSFAPTGPVLNDLPAGYTVSGPSVVDNHWTDPFAPPSSDVVVTSCADPALAGLTNVRGSLIFRNLAGCAEIALPNLREVHGDLIVENNPGLTHVSFTGPVVVDGSVRIVNNDVAGDVEVVGVTASGDLTIDDNSVGGAIDVSGTGGDLTIDGNDADAINVSGGTGGDLTITDNGTTVVNAGGSTSVAGDLDISTGAATVSAVTADGTTDVAMLNGPASLHAVLPAGAFDGPVGFTIAHRFDDPPENGTASDGSTAVVDPLATYRFTFGVPALNSPARLMFTVDMSQLDAAARATLLNALASGTATVVGKGDAAGAAYAAFSVCTAAQTPDADGCVAVASLAADGTPTTGDPSFVRFDGVVGHFSSYAVATVTPRRDTTDPTVTVPADIAVDATRPSGATVIYAASATDDRDPSPSVVCTPASGSVFAIGTTHVACVANDAAGNTAQAGFSVHVRGAGEQLVRLIDKTRAFLDQPALSLALRTQLQAAVDAFAAKRPRAACLVLDLYIAAVRLAPTRALTPAERSELVADATRIKAVIGC
jgi:HYR domain